MTRRDFTTIKEGSGDDPNSTPPTIYDGISPLWQLICRNRGDPCKHSVLELITNLLEDGYDVNEEWDYEELLRQYNSKLSYFTILDYVYGPKEDWSSIMVTPLLAAISAKDFELVHLLLRYGANVHVWSKLSTTALHEGVRTGSEGMVKTLLDYGADIEAKTFTSHHLGCTPLHFAAINTDDAMITYLTDNGANVRATTAAGWTALDIAILNRQVGLVDALLQLLNPSHWARELKPRVEQPCSRPADTESLARHIIKHGIRNTDNSHEKLYAECFSSLVKQLEPLSVASGKLGESLVFGVERGLLQLAGPRTDILWARKSCAPCQNFQSLDYVDLCSPFKHSGSFDALNLSAAQGCHLCQALIEVYARNDDRTRDMEHLCASSEVQLQLVDEFYGGRKILVGCDGKVGRLVLRLVNDEVHTAISSTSPSDIHGPDSQGTLTVAKAWMQCCIASHQTCQSSDELLLPTRIIDVGSETRQPFLVESLRKEARYATLSYCRGDEDVLCTTRSNYEQHLVEIQLHDMPKTIHDAVYIIRGLGIPYLWVDSLCVIQDSEEDWEAQSTRMQSVFSNATLTIAAQKSSECSRGCLAPRNWTSSAAIPLDLRLPARLDRAGGSSQINRIMAMTQPYTSRGGHGSTVLTDRGWTLQEEVLSRRILRCYDAEIYWECLESECSETGLFVGAPQPQYTGQIRWALLAGTEYWEKKPANRRSMLEYWQRLVTVYSHRHLSQSRDKVFGLIGAQNRFADVLNDTPLLGCWAGEHFWPICLWTCATIGTPRSNPGIVCPSWSWASVSTPVAYSYDDSAAIFHPRVTSWNLQTIKQNVHVVGSISVLCDLLRPQDLLKTVDPNEAWNERMTDHFERYRADNPTTLLLHSPYVLPPNPRTESFVYSTRQDPHSSISPNDVWYLHVADRPSQPSPEIPRGFVCVYPTWPQGRPPSAVLMCLEKISPDKKHFRRIGLAEAYDDPEWRGKRMRHSIELF